MFNLLRYEPILFLHPHYPLVAYVRRLHSRYWKPEFQWPYERRIESVHVVLLPLVRRHVRQQSAKVFRVELSDGVPMHLSAIMQSCRANHRRSSESARLTPSYAAWPKFHAALYSRLERPSPPVEVCFDFMGSGGDRLPWESLACSLGHLSIIAVAKYAPIIAGHFSPSRRSDGKSVMA